MEISTQIDNLTNECDNNHYLKKSIKENKTYYQNFQTTISRLKDSLSDKQLKDLLENKLLLKQNFKDSVYLQSATELSINSFFYNISPETFKYELKVNPNNKKDVDCQIEIDNVEYNIEVKCPDLTDKLNIPKDILKVSFGTRLPNLDQVREDLETITEEVINSKISNFNNSKLLKRDDNKMKDYLLDAHKKFTNSDGLNVLFVPLNSLESFDEWLQYLIDPNAGLFTNNSFINVKEFNKVDLVVFTNLMNSHLYNDKSPIANPWDLSKHFNIIQCNPNRIKDKAKAIHKFYKELLPNYSDSLANHYNSLDLISQTTGIKSFVIEEIKNKLGLHYFI